ncbi:hypothetical protein [Haloarcula salinisoli]|uniref:DUF4352 domain-containing protein n=1 Tax=Haloarcula salinisoli TaxID=2487746 RepID=A0A8J7YIY4_9EURY|nr:hypothetical protein [Halomicroarcula salinisoli]MBX0303954.1 hypothetical protein [Halomicroarcula salinisoli]
MRENNSDREATLSRRGVLAATGTTSIALVAGCSSDDGAGTDDGDEDSAVTEDGETSTGDGAMSTEDSTPTEDGAMSTEDGETPTEDDTSSSPATGTASSSVEELTIVDHEPDLDYFGNDDAFGVALTMENDGEQETDLDRYFYSIVPYDVDGNDVSETYTGTSFGDKPTTIGPGEQLTFVPFVNLKTSASEVDRYELQLSCRSSVGSESDAAYCQ